MILSEGWFAGEKIIEKETLIQILWLFLFVFGKHMGKNEILVGKIANGAGKADEKRMLIQSQQINFKRSVRNGIYDIKTSR